jgi:3-isopropylmalate/(R)-2-methylmalate dehydratase small subunit
VKQFETLTGTAIPFGAKNVDTDVIIPARFLKTITRAGLGKHAFAGLREGQPENIFDSARNAGAPILIAGDNFGCGSSREHAPWAIGDMGIRAVIAPSFADIFSGNAFKNGILTVALPQAQVDRLLEIAGEVEITIDLENQVVTTPFQDRFTFEIDPFRKTCLMQGLDEIGLTERMAGDIDGYEAKRSAARPWVDGAAKRAA